jgi:hypothetical protein
VNPTQQVSAVFAANSDWTVNVIDIDSNVVRTAAGSGSSMLFNFDGNDTNGASLPPGVYYYQISAQTNGADFSFVAGGGSLFSTMDDISQLWILPSDDSGSPVPLSLYPPGFDTNGLSVIDATSLEMEALMPFSSDLESFGGGSASPAAFSGPSAQTAVAPSRPPSIPAVRAAGTYGIGYQRYLSWTNKYSPPSPLDGSLTGHHIQMQGAGGNAPISYHALGAYGTEAKNFVEGMQLWAGWQQKINKVDDNLKLSDLQGTGSPFNGVNLAVLLLHGTYGTSLDFAANQCFQMYFPIATGGTGTYLRMSDMNWGGSGTNGLRWMAIMACFSMQHNNWASMKTQGIKPYNSNLHLLLGCDTTEYADPDMLSYWASSMAWGVTNHNPMEIRVAWYTSAQRAYQYAIMPDGQTPLQWAVAGDLSCYHDRFQTNFNPTGSWFYEKDQVWPPQ